MIKVGDIYYEVYVSVECDKGKYVCELDLNEWHITYLNSKNIYFKQKTSFTWIKKSKTHFDYGWADNISEYFKKTVPVDTEMSSIKFFKTKEAAYRSALPALKLQEKAVQVMIRKVEKKLKTKSNDK